MTYQQKTDLELEKAMALKALRSNIRLHYSLQADRTINRLLPEWEMKIDDAIHRGQSVDMALSQVLGELEASE
jgi:hypothetical protein